MKLKSLLPERAALMSKNPRKFREPVRLIVSVEAQTVNSIDAATKAGGNQGHHNRSEFVRLAIERELRRCQSDGFRSSNAHEGD
ncbi:hypothetical protein ATI45_4322 [Marinobacter sp. LV10MA510-1]|nr:hypothetical protein ATI45_4322 [Marinobacter sp. LV10MA510-1]